MDIEKIHVWQKSMQLAEFIYESTKKMPKEELYGLVSQMRRAAVSVPSNIAEGSQRSTGKDFANFLLIARGSLAELKTQFVLASRLEFLPKEIALEGIHRIDEISKMLYGFHSQVLKGHNLHLKTNNS